MNPTDLEENENNENNPENGNSSGHMYSYREQNQNQFPQETPAMRRSIGEGNLYAPNPINSSHNQRSSLPVDRPIRQNSIIVQVQPNPPKLWMFFLFFMIIHVIIIVIIANYLFWGNGNLPSNYENIEKLAKKKIKYQFSIFRDINIIIFFGFSLFHSNLKHHSIGAILITILCGVTSFEMGIISTLCWHSIYKDEWENGYFNFSMLFESIFHAATVVISLGAVLGKLSIPQYFLFSFMESFFVGMNSFLCREKLHVIDSGGSMTVHLFAAIFGCVVSLILYCPKSEKERINNSPHLGTNYNSTIFGIIGILFIFIYFPSFNIALIGNDTLMNYERKSDKEEGKFYNIENNQTYYNTTEFYSFLLKAKYRSVINTYLSLGCSLMGSALTSPFFYKGRIRIEHILNSSITGGIVMGACCYVCYYHWASMILGLLTGIICTVAYSTLEPLSIGCGYHDTFGIIFNHGIGGLLGGIFSAIFIAAMGCGNMWYHKEDCQLDFDNKSDDFFEGILSKYNDQYAQGLIQMAGVLLSVAFAVVSGIVVGYIIKACNCNNTVRYFDDTEYIKEIENELFPWEDEVLQNDANYNDNKFNNNNYNNYNGNAPGSSAQNPAFPGASYM